MTNNPDTQPDFNKLREKAEELFKQNPDIKHLPQTEEQKQLLFSELQVHQIELEMQNEELMRARAEVEFLLDRYTELYDFAPVSYLSLLHNSELIQCNLSTERFFEMERARLIGRRLSDFIPQGSLPAFNNFLNKVFKSNNKVTFEVGLVINGNTNPFACQGEAAKVAPVNQKMVRFEAVAANDLQSCRCILVDITEHKIVQDILMFLVRSEWEFSQENVFKNLARYLADFLGLDLVSINRLEGNGQNLQSLAVYRDGNFIENTSQSLAGSPCGVVFGQTICCYQSGVRKYFPDDQMLGSLRAESFIATTLWNSAGNPIGLIAAVGRQPIREQKLSEIVINLAALRASGELERQQAEEENEKTREKLRQAQKVEAIGQLAGGLAHDFNNLLGVIIGNTEKAITLTSTSHPAYANLAEILMAASSSADLTGQLLAFARKQTIIPRVLDINQAIDNKMKIFKRLVRENIELVFVPNPGAWNIHIDPSQVDQIMTNLLVNSRDAITGVGKILIETGNYVCGENGNPAVPEMMPGEYVFLCISDNGSGIKTELLTRVQDPFFSTKPLGKGTGLGLASVNGIVNQNNGYIHISSQEGIGTQVTLYFPRTRAHIAPVRVSSRNAISQSQGEVILLVEDEEALLSLVKDTLEDLGYHVFAASSPLQALTIAQEKASEIQLLITDVIMPEMNGKMLAERVKSFQPQIKCLFMSGYTADIISNVGNLSKDVQFIQKPFFIKDLAEKINQMVRGEE